MKKLLFVSFFLLVSLASIAQTSVKKVAILETINKGGDINTGIKTMVRSNLSKAISKTPGFVGYDRVNISQIMSEQDFQRSGMVNEEQIKKLGEMYGADYILISQVETVSENYIFVTATITNVETAQEVGTDNATMTTTPPDMQAGCESLAYRLLGMEEPYSNVKQVAANKEPEKSVVKETKTAAVVTNTSSSQSKVGDIKVFPDGTQGVVFYMENGRGLAVSLTERELKWDANRKLEDIAALDNTDENNHPFIYGQGKANTQAAIQQLGTNAQAASWCVGMGDGWYMPSSGELYYLMTVSKKGSPLFNKLNAIGAKLSGWYWASTEHNRKEAMNVSDGGTVFTEDKDSEVKVRAIRAFTE